MKTEEQNKNIVSDVTPSRLQLSLKTKWFEITKSGAEINKLYFVIKHGTILV